MTVLFSDLSSTNPQALQGQMMGHQTAVDTLRKTAESLVTSEGDLLSNLDEIQETVGEQSQICIHENTEMVSKGQPF